MVTKTEPALDDHRQDLSTLSIALVSALGLTFIVLFLCTVPFAKDIAGSRDFVSYWATGQLLVKGANPYDRDAIANVEHAAHLDPRAVLIMRNPPWSLPIAYPLGFLGLRTAAFLWTLLLAACLAVSVMLIRRLEGSKSGLAYWLGLAFTPAILSITMGQTSLFALLGLVLFLRYHSRRPFWAGLALWFCLLKPHLFLPFGASLLIWMVYRKAWRVATGAVAALALSLLITWLVAPDAWQHYLALMRSPTVQNDFIPCLAFVARLKLRPQSIWLQYIPAIFCSIWAALYYWRRRMNWNWTEHSAPLMLVSLVFAPYCWFYDQCLAIPALLHGAYMTRNRHMLTLLAGLILSADIQLCLVKIFSPVWLWTAPAWLAWFLATMQFKKNDRALSPDNPS